MLQAIFLAALLNVFAELSSRVAAMLNSFKFERASTFAIKWLILQEIGPICPVPPTVTGSQLLWKSITLRRTGCFLRLKGARRRQKPVFDWPSFPAPVGLRRLKWIVDVINEQRKE